jgi:hypothetical protein
MIGNNLIILSIEGSGECNRVVLGGNSVTNDAERVLQKIEQWNPGTLARCRIMYRDSRGCWDGMDWDGQEVRFFPLRETDEAAAERKLRLRPRDG